MVVIVKRLEQLAKDALRCVEVWVADGNRPHGLTTALGIDARTRRDVQDLFRCASTSSAPFTASSLSVSTSPAHPNDPLREALPLLLAASWFLLVTDDHAEPGEPEVWFAAPPARDCLIELIAVTAC